MIQTVEAVIDEYGEVRLSNSIRLSAPRRALVMILDEPPLADIETASPSEVALGIDWERAAENAAWAHLQ